MNSRLGKLKQVRAESPLGCANSPTPKPITPTSKSNAVAPIKLRLMNQSQLDCIEQCKRLLGERFDAYVLVTANDGEDDYQVEEVNTFHGGGFATAIGLMEMAKVTMLTGEPASGEEDG